MLSSIPVSTHINQKHLLPSLSCSNQKCLQTLLNLLWGRKKLTLLKIIGSSLTKGLFFIPLALCQHFAFWEGMIRRLSSNTQKDNQHCLMIEMYPFSGCLKMHLRFQDSKLQYITENTRVDTMFIGKTKKKQRIIIMKFPFLKIEYIILRKTLWPSDSKQISYFLPVELEVESSLGLFPLSFSRGRKDNAAQ